MVDLVDVEVGGERLGYVLSAIVRSVSLSAREWLWRTLRVWYSVFIILHEAHYLMNLNSWRPWKRVIASNDPVHSESMITTSCPCWRRSSTKWPPRKPAPLINSR